MSQLGTLLELGLLYLELRKGSLSKVGHQHPLIYLEHITILGSHEHAVVSQPKSVVPFKSQALVILEGLLQE